MEQDIGLLSGSSRRRWWARLIWIGIWLVFLAPLMQRIVRGEYHPAVLAAAGLFAYAALFIRVFWLAFGYPGKMRQIWVTVSALTFITLATSIGFGGYWILLFIYLSPALAIALPQRWAVAAVLMVTAVMGALALIGQSMSVGDTMNLLFGPLFGGLLTVFVKRTRGLIRELRETREELARAAVAEERLRFSRDLHDLLGHTLSLVVVKSEVVRRLAERGEADSAAREAADIEVAGRQALAEVREAVTGYRGRGLAAELDGARSALTDAGIEVTINISGTPLPAPSDALVGWAIREGTTNTIRHSKARHCEISVSRNEEGARLEITDDGVGEDSTADASGSGLRGLAERAAGVGGRFDTGFRPGGGFRLSVTVPFREEKNKTPEYSQ